MSQNLEAFLRKVKTLPSLPVIYEDLTREADNPFASLESVGDIIRRDPGLTTRLLKLANSALYGVPTRISSLEEALQMIGMQEMRDLALSTVVVKMFTGLPPELVDIGKFWQHSVAVAVAGSVLAAQRSNPVPERLFVGGLLHDVGRLVFYLHAPKEYLKVIERCAKTGERTTVVEHEIMGFDHATLGGALLKHWNMPANLVQMVQYHHQPTLAPAAAEETSLIHFADFLAAMLELGDGGERMIEPLSEEGWKRCLLDEEGLERAVPDIEQRYASISRALTG